MKWARVAKFSAALAVLCTVAICAPLAFNMIREEIRHRQELSDPVVASPEETRAILSVVLDQMKFFGVPLPPPETGEAPRPEPERELILTDQSLCFSGNKPDSDCGVETADRFLIPDLDQFAPRKLREELALANQERHSLDLSGIPGTEVAHASDIQKIFKAGWWNNFYKKYPGTSGFAEISRPVLTKDRQEALILIAHHCDGLCGSGNILLLRKEKADWRVIREEMLWIN